MDNLNRPFNNAKQTLRNMRDIEEIIKKIDFGTFENANKILDPLDGKYKSIKEFSVEYFGGAPTESILRWIAKSNQTFSLTHIYAKGEFTLYVHEDTKEGIWVVSKVDDNVGNLPPKTPMSENDFWISLAAAPIPINEIVEILKPFISQEIDRQLPDVVNKFANDNPSFSKDLILLANGDAGVEHFKTTYKLSDSNVNVSDFTPWEEKWENIGYTFSGYNTFKTLQPLNLFSKIKINGWVKMYNGVVIICVNEVIEIDKIGEWGAIKPLGSSDIELYIGGLTVHTPDSVEIRGYSYTGGNIGKIKEYQSIIIEGVRK